MATKPLKVRRCAKKSPPPACHLCMLSELRHFHCTSMVAFYPSPPIFADGIGTARLAEQFVGGLSPNWPTFRRPSTVNTSFILLSLRARPNQNEDPAVKRSIVREYFNANAEVIAEIYNAGFVFMPQPNWLWDLALVEHTSEWFINEFRAFIDAIYDKLLRIEITEQTPSPILSLSDEGID